LSKLAAPDLSRSSSASIKDSSRKVGENKLLTRLGGSSGSKSRYQPYGDKCEDCLKTVNTCDAGQTANLRWYAIKEDICSIRGKRILDMTGYAMVNK